MRPAKFLLPLGNCALLLALMMLAAPARGVVITTSSDAPNVVAPGNDPGWNNVGRVANGTGVYLGNRWVITANHVLDGGLLLNDGRGFAASIGSNLQLDNPAGVPGSPDLRMFRLAQDPGLPSLAVANQAPGIGSQLTMIGRGTDRSNTLIGWRVTGDRWQEVSLPAANVRGYALDSGSTMRWGRNTVSTGSSFTDDQTFSFNTRFDESGIPFEAQATPGDSGGGAFFLRNGSWELVGVMTSTRKSEGQPDDTVAFGNRTVIADLSVYREQIFDLLLREDALWQNQFNHFDVSRSGDLTVRDLQLVINDLLAGGVRELDAAPGANDWFVDVNGDNRVSVGDAQRVINGLLDTADGPRAASAGTNFVPEPSAAALAAAGAAFLVLGRFVSRRRRRAHAA